MQRKFKVGGESLRLSFCLNKRQDAKHTGTSAGFCPQSSALRGENKGYNAHYVGAVLPKLI